MVNLKQEITIDHSSTLCDDISSLYLNKKASNITLYLDNEELFAHKNILAARCSYFDTLLFTEDEDNQESELSITDDSPEAFRKILKYIYTGRITISPSTVELIEIMALARKYSLRNLEMAMVNEAKINVDLNNVCSILNTATLYDLTQLKDDCITFMEAHSSEILASDCFESLTQASIIQILQRDTFFAPEIEIFKKVNQWSQKNNDVHNLVIGCVRLSCLTVVDIVSIVWPSKLVGNEKLLQAIAEIVDVKPKTSTCRGRLLRDENVASPKHGAEVISGQTTTSLLTGNRDMGRYAKYAIGDKDGITIKFDCPRLINNIRMMLWDQDQRYYHYYIEVSRDQKKWEKVIDFTSYCCRSEQDLYFGPVIAQFVRNIGTYNTANNEFHLVYFEAYFKSTIPKALNGIISPASNVATPEKKALVIAGTNPGALLDGVTTNHSSHTSHDIGSGSIIVQLAQPYRISSVKLLLWDGDDRTYKYYVESSTNKSDWTIVEDRRNEASKSWQSFNFPAREVVFVRIAGTHNSANNTFHLMHFECFANDSKVETSKTTVQIYK